MKFKFLIVAGITAASVLMCGPNKVHGAEITAEEVVSDYLAYEQIPPNGAFLINTTAYCHGDTCCRGVKAREGIAAGPVEWYGMAAMVYEAVETECGVYEQGGLLGVFEILDTGYGRSTGDGVPSKVRSDKKSRGTIEVGQCIDIYKPTYDKAKEWMELTGGKCFVQIVEDAKG